MSTFKSIYLVVRSVALLPVILMKLHVIAAVHRGNPAVPTLAGPVHQQSALSQAEGGMGEGGKGQQESSGS